MKKIFASKYWWIYILVALVVLNYLASIVHFRYDLTEEKRYTLSEPTRRLLKDLKDQVNITVFLEGDMPAGFKKLSNSTGELLQEFKELGKTNIQFRFQKPGEGLNDTARINFIHFLDSLGLSPTTCGILSLCKSWTRSLLIRTPYRNSWSSRFSPRSKAIKSLFVRNRLSISA